MKTTNIVKLDTYRRPAVSSARTLPGRIATPKEAAVICLQTVRTRKAFQSWLPEHY